MLGTTREQQIFIALLAKYGKSIADAFRAAIADLKSGADLARLVQAISRNDLNAAIDALHLDPAAMQPLRDAISSAYRDGGSAAVNAMPVLKDAAGARFVIRFAVGNPRAETWLKDHSSQLVTRIMEDQRATLRQALTVGMQEGANPRTTALDIIGRVSRTTGKREGGFIGLSGPQGEYLTAARAELASTDPAMLKNYLARTIRDKRFDSRVLKAIQTGEPIPADIQEKMATSYSNRMLKLRGDTIARTESLTSLHAGQEEAFQQAIDSGAVKGENVRNIWHSAEDARVRFSHAVLNGESVAQGQPFTSPSGAMMLYPGDTSFGAPPSETINCRCWRQKRIDFLSNLR